MKKKIVLLVLVLFVVCFLGRFLHKNQNEIIYEKMWNISIPNSADEVYSAKSEMGFNGDGLRYSIYVGCDEPVNGIDFISDSNEEIEKEIYLKLREINVEDNRLPNFSDNYSWCCVEKNNDFLWLVKANDCLYVLQYTK